jgi:hypothetical protein
MTWHWADVGLKWGVGQHARPQQSLFGNTLVQPGPQAPLQPPWQQRTLFGNGPVPPRPHGPPRGPPRVMDPNADEHEVPEEEEPPRGPMDSMSDENIESLMMLMACIK